MYTARMSNNSSRTVVFESYANKNSKSSASESSSQSSQVETTRKPQLVKQISKIFELENSSSLGTKNSRQFQSLDIKNSKANRFISEREVFQNNAPNSNQNGIENSKNIDPSLKNERVANKMQLKNVNSNINHEKMDENSSPNDIYMMKDKIKVFENIIRSKVDASKSFSNDKTKNSKSVKTQNSSENKNLYQVFNLALTKTRTLPEVEIENKSMVNYNEGIVYAVNSTILENNHKLTPFDEDLERGYFGKKLNKKQENSETSEFGNANRSTLTAVVSTGTPESKNKMSNNLGNINSVKSLVSEFQKTSKKYEETAKPIQSLERKKINSKIAETSSNGSNEILISERDKKDISLGNDLGITKINNKNYLNYQINNNKTIEKYDDGTMSNVKKNSIQIDYWKQIEKSASNSKKENTNKMIPTSSIRNTLKKSNFNSEESKPSLTFLKSSEDNGGLSKSVMTKTVLNKEMSSEIVLEGKDGYSETFLENTGKGKSEKSLISNVNLPEHRRKSNSSNEKTSKPSNSTPISNIDSKHSKPKIYKEELKEKNPKSSYKIGEYDVAKAETKNDKSENISNEDKFKDFETKNKINIKQNKHPQNHEEELRKKLSKFYEIDHYIVEGESEGKNSASMDKNSENLQKNNKLSGKQSNIIKSNDHGNIYQYKIGQKSKEEVIDDWVSVENVNLNENQNEIDTPQKPQKNNSEKQQLEFSYKIGTKSQEELDFSKDFKPVAAARYKPNSNVNGQIKNKNKTDSGNIDSKDHSQLEDFLTKHIEKTMLMKNKPASREKIESTPSPTESDVKITFGATRYRKTSRPTIPKDFKELEDEKKEVPRGSFPTEEPLSVPEPDYD